MNLAHAHESVVMRDSLTGREMACTILIVNLRR